MNELGSAIAGALLALALLVAGAPATRHGSDAPRASANHAVVDASAPSLHVVAGALAGTTAHAPRRTAGDGAAAWLAVRPFVAATPAPSGAPSARRHSEPHSVVAAGFDATAPPAA